jgi:hypothetical protein
MQCTNSEQAALQQVNASKMALKDKITILQTVEVPAAKKLVNCTGNPRVFLAIPVPLPVKTRTLAVGQGWMAGSINCTHG